MLSPITLGGNGEMVFGQGLTCAALCVSMDVFEGFQSRCHCQILTGVITRFLLVPMGVVNPLLSPPSPVH